MQDNGMLITLYKAKITGLLHEALFLMDVELRLIEVEEVNICGPEHREMAREIWRKRHNILYALADEMDDCEGDK